MDNFQSRTQKHQLKHKKRLTQEQLRLLETSFNLNTKLDPERKSQLAQELGLPSTRVAIWYQNRRARNKNQSLEDDHKALKLKLETVMEDNARLQDEVQRLKQDLNKVREIFGTFNSSLSSSCDDVGSSDLLNGSKHHLEKDLYASMVADGGPFGSSDGYDFFSSSVS
ncbi:homeobox-leucine zipper ATHB-52-like [Olea europaea subsp. europaea]|uniref:Homeobox-leucine zipper protein n=1 Tax=Olea europaea subsp. europaea TaxID=158383 RepID=A0A8S0V808_OLEEU|nr:homeobox-leucine zipper ATHB-52-like [Olea europaea subsp. europaea]CAA3026220.1 homeobox-leucine zipper ATHB-52-like [Olea europaea subsp. europaea]